MAKKVKAKTSRRLSDEEYWDEWGERFGKKMEKKGEAFERKMESMFEKKGKHFKEKWDCTWHPFGIIGPLIGSIIGIVVLVIIVWIINWINGGLGSTFITSLTGFVSANLAWFFAAGLLFSYMEYISKSLGHFKYFIKPIISAAGIAFVAWLIGAVFSAINVSAQSSFIAKIAVLLSMNVMNIFVAVLALGYVVLIIGHFARMVNEEN